MSTKRRPARSRLAYLIIAALLTLVLLAGCGKDIVDDWIEPPQTSSGIQAADVHRQGNNANGGWVLQGEDGETFIGTEHGLFLLDKDGDFHRYTSFPALWLNRYGEYLVYAEYDSSYSEGLGIRAFELNPLSEPYPTEMLYEGTAAYVQVQESGWIYCLSDGVLWRANLAPLSETGEGIAKTLKPEPVAWESLAATGGDVAPAPHGVPQAPALSSLGVYIKLDTDGARHQETVYLYSDDGKNAQKVTALSDVSFREMFWFEPAEKLLFQGSVYENGSLENAAGGVFALTPEGEEITQLSDDALSDFNVWFDGESVTAEKPYPVWLVMAGGVAEGSRSGIYKIDVGGETAGEPVRLYDGPAMAPNIANGYIYFRVPSEREGAMYDYYRVRADGSFAAERLDFEAKTIEKV